MTPIDHHLNGTPIFAPLDLAIQAAMLPVFYLDGIPPATQCGSTRDVAGKNSGVSMLTYFLAKQVDGRIVLDRECHGSLLKTIEVSEPSVIRREINGEMIESPQYHESYAEALGSVDRSHFRHVPGEGYFAKAD